MTEQLPAPIEPSRAITIHIPSAAYIKEAISEPGPVRSHFLSALSTIATIFLVVTFIAFPVLFQAAIALAFAGAVVAGIHWFYYSMFFDPDDRGY